MKLPKTFRRKERKIRGYQESDANFLPFFPQGILKKKNVAICQCPLEVGLVLVKSFLMPNFSYSFLSTLLRGAEGTDPASTEQNFPERLLRVRGTVGHCGHKH